MKKETWYQKLEFKRKPDLTLKINGTIYLKRWWLIPRTKFFNIYLHKITGDDLPIFHDHPWLSLSYCLRGTMIEHLPHKTRIVDNGDFYFRLPSTLHFLRLFLPKSTVWTLFITGPKVRQWGFMTNEGWIPEYDYQRKNGIEEY